MHAYADRAGIGSDQFVYWNAADPARGLAPDAFVRFGAPDEDFDTWGQFFFVRRTRDRFDSPRLALCPAKRAVENNLGRAGALKVGRIGNIVLSATGPSQSNGKTFDAFRFAAGADELTFRCPRRVTVLKMGKVFQGNANDRLLLAYLKALQA